MSRALLLAACLLACGCILHAFADVLPTPEQQAIAREYVDKLRARDFADLVRDMHDDFIDKDLSSRLNRMADEFPAGEPRDVRVLFSRSENRSGVGVVSMHSFEYDYGEQKVRTTVAFRERGTARTITSFDVQGRSVRPQGDSQAPAAAAPKPPFDPELFNQVLVGLALAFLVLGGLTVLVIEARERRKRRKAGQSR